MEIIERIKKLHALSERNNSTAEAAAAAEKIQELCFKYNLELEEILKTPGQQKAPYVKSDYVLPQATRFDVAWKRSLFSGVCKANFCMAIYYPNSARMGVVGQKHNFEAAVYTYEYIVREIERLGREGLKNQGFLWGKEKQRYFKGFCEGASSTLYWKMVNSVKRQADQGSESKALVVLKDKELDVAVKSYFPHMRKGGTRTIGGSSNGYSDGAKAAQNISVNRGVAGGNRTLIG